MMNEKCAACIHCEVCGLIESEVAKGGACDFYEDGKRWIPVSERLPEAGKQYLCCNEDGFREVGYLSKVTGEWGFTDTEAFGEVIAWMPLPEPYKAESEEKDADSN